jgi:hypothetical protein
MLNKLLVLSLAALMSSQSYSANLQRKNEKKLYVGSNSTEAVMTYTGVVQYEAGRAPTLKTMTKVIEEQIQHTIGPMSVAKFSAVPKGDHVITDVKIQSKVGTIYNISYNFEGRIVVENGPTSTYEIMLATNPAKIYAASFVGDVSPCTDAHYQSEGDFWYFWNPYNPGCKLKKGVDFTILKAKITRFTNSTLTYPEYQNLPDEKGNINIHVLFGLDDNTNSRNPLESTDINATNYREFRNYLLKKGYVAKQWTAAQVNMIAKTTNGDAPFVETVSKGKIIYRFFFGPSAINEDSLAFHWFYKDAIENSSVMIYGGHSGLGGHLDLDSIEQNLGEPIKFNTNKYQIFFFDSCTSYKYYNDAYLKRKATALDPNGTKKLDIFTNGLSTYFHVMTDANKAMAEAFDKALGYAISGKGFVSYQSLAKQIDSDNLFGINGDEDNEAPAATK